VAIRALPAIIAAYPQARLIIGGDASWGSKVYADELVRLARSLNLESRVVFEGFVSDPYSFFTCCDLALHTSVMPEPFGQVIVEALAVGRPVVASDAGGPREILAGHAGGVLVPPGDPSALATATLELLADDARRGALAERAVERAQQYTLEESAKRTRAVLEAVVDSAR